MKYWDQKTVKKIREGYYSAVYFNRTKYILEQEGNLVSVTMQIFQWQDESTLCGVNEVIELFQAGVGSWRNNKWISQCHKLQVSALQDGDLVARGESVMHITGPYVYFAHLESLYLGILARRTMVATNTCHVVKAARGKPVFFFADRFDDFLNQEGDGYAAHVGGATGVCTSAHASRWNGVPVGTIPHALIAVNGGDTVTTVRLFAKHVPNVNVIALVDFDNDCVGTSLAVARALGKKLWGVRLDTASDTVDQSLAKTKGDNKNNYGVNPMLVELVQKALNTAGINHVKILVSGGFNAEKIALFEKKRVPVDGYGVGSALIHGNNDFTADIVKVGGKPIAKIGRTYKPNRRFQTVNL
ncbi:hypothetical protein A2154_04855 [Candidatus Gottesmanbacteria bacterium RBG_16_43_7]|uniref:nicotinate phosphoribosyltransferase n=1 Tax=Candidatus Gottesmanbacteria bacterium RBG_16_43_7 TaxID=1798373 RepID=A0A1F5Z984_9BACT|nr:MAG: hypothetical protein A2154_04855 [Candidatus Gottesmanbacteria bacterium RBG_16_43_7]